MKILGGSLPAVGRLSNSDLGEVVKLGGWFSVRERCVAVRVRLAVAPAGGFSGRLDEVLGGGW